MIRFNTEQAQGSVSAAVKWAQAIDIGQGFDSVLAEFQSLIGAETVQIVRHLRDLDHTRTIARQEKSAGKLFERPQRSFARTMLGDLLHSTNLGSVFLLSEIGASQDAQCAIDELGLRDVAILSLCNDRGSSDFLEFQFEGRLLDHNRQLLDMLGGILSQSWRNRTPGAVAELLARHPFPTAQVCPPKFENILGSHNPAGLTRSEFRICMLVQEGRLPEEISEILQVRKSTFRSHLRAIYFKTEVSGHVALVHLLHRTNGGEMDEQVQVTAHH